MIEKKFEAKVYLTFWIIVVTALMLATVYQATALNRDISRIAGSIRVKLPSIILIGGIAQFFLFRINRRIKGKLREFERGVTPSEDFVIQLQKHIGHLKVVFIIVNSVGFFLGPVITFIIYHFTGKSYPGGEIFFIIAIHLLVGTLASFLQISFVRMVFQDILSYCRIHKNIEKLRTMDSFRNRLLLGLTLLLLFLFLNGGQVYGILTNIAAGSLNPADSGWKLIGGFLISSLSYLVILMTSFFFLSGEEHKKIRQLQRSLDENLTSRDSSLSKINIISYDDYGDLAEAVNAYTDRLEKLAANISQAGETVGRTSADLSNSIEQSESGLAKMGEISASITGEIGKGRETLEEASRSVNGMISSVGSIARSVSTQGHLVAESSAAIDEMGANIRSVADMSKKASQVTRDLNDLTIRGSERIRDTVSSVANLRDASGQVRTIINTIQSISAQTNLLAMNAAIEAAHAGKAGAGFSVVADEVRKLAEESTQSAKMIKSIIKDMTDGIDRGMESAERTDDIFGEITGSVEETTRIIYQVSASMDEQQAAANDIGGAMNSLVDVSDTLRRESEQQNSLSSGMNASFSALLSSMEELRQKADQLMEEDRLLRDGVELLRNVGDDNGRAVELLEKAVNDVE